MVRCFFIVEMIKCLKISLRQAPIWRRWQRRIFMMAVVPLFRRVLHSRIGEEGCQRFQLIAPMPPKLGCVTEREAVNLVECGSVFLGDFQAWPVGIRCGAHGYLLWGRIQTRYPESQNDFFLFLFDGKSWQVDTVYLVGRFDQKNIFDNGICFESGLSCRDPPRELAMR